MLWTGAAIGFLLAIPIVSSFFLAARSGVKTYNDGRHDAFIAVEVFLRDWAQVTAPLAPRGELSYGCLRSLLLTQASYQVGEMRRRYEEMGK